MTDGGQPETRDSDIEASARVPLCVDLDGTLLRGDSLVESLLKLFRRNPLHLLSLPAWLSGGRARLKAEIAERVLLDPESLPYNEEFVEYLEVEHRRGRRLILATASHESTARAVADHLGLFSAVIATDSRRNLKGGEKRDELVRRFGDRGFDYAGDSVADLEVWSAAREVIAVNPPAAVVRRLGERATKVIRSPRPPLPVLVLRAMRVRQWVKNLLILLPITLAHRLLDPEPLTRSLLAFLAFGLGASAVYVLNDLLDVEADRHHPTKRRRPFASGELPLLAGFVMIPLLLAPSLAIAAILPRAFLLVLLLYFVLTTAYTLVLKEIALIDVLLLASLFTLRIIAGATASTVTVSEWLLAFSMFVFLSLAAVKRYAELRRLRAKDDPEARIRRRGYVAGDLDLMVQMGLSSGYIAVLVLALYISSDRVTALYSRPVFLWGACPLMLYWISRIWFLAHRGTVEDDPLDFAVRDPTTWVVGLLCGATVFAAAGGF